MWTFAVAVMLTLAQQYGDVNISVGSPNGRIDAEGSEGKRLIRAQDSVVVLYQDMRVEADWITYDEATKNLVAGDKVHFTRGTEKLDGSRFEMDVGTKIGKLTDAKGEIAGYFITATEVRRLPDGPDDWKYNLKQAKVSTCGECPDWDFQSGNAVVYPNKRVTAKHTYLKFWKVPVFYLPWLVVPSMDRSRASGFLIPSTSSSTTRGRGFSESFYWAINRSADATFTGEHYSLRGYAEKVGFRTQPNESTRIDVSTYHVNDRLRDSLGRYQGGTQSHILAFSGIYGFRTVANVDIYSSLVFRQAWGDGLNVISSPIQRPLIFATRNNPRSSLNFTYDRTEVFFAAEPSIVMRKFPAFEAQAPSRRISRGLPIYLSVDTSAASVARRDSQSATSPSISRFDLHPSLDIPVMSSSILELGMRFGVRETAYTHSFDSGQISSDMLNRFSLDYTMQLSGPQLERRIGALRHVIQPGVEYRYVGGVDRLRQTVSVDGVDLIASTNEVEYSITNRLMGDREVLSWRVAQKMFFQPGFNGALLSGRRNAFAPLLDLTGFAYADESRRLSPVVSTLRISALKGVSTDLQADYDTTFREFRNAGILASVTRGKITSSTSYTYTRPNALQASNNQLITSIGYNNPKSLSVTYGFSYDVHRSVFQGSGTSVSYNHKDCFWLSFAFTGFDIGVRQEKSVRFALTLKGIGSLGTIPTANDIFR